MYWLFAAVRRDFTALKVFLDVAGIDEARFDREQAFLEAEQSVHIEKDEEVSAILAMYEKRVGRSAFKVRELYVIFFFDSLALFTESHFFIIEL